MPSIVDGPLPSNSEPICATPAYPAVTPDFEAGPYVGDIIPDFTLYTLGGEPFVASEKLASGKPLLLVSGSYTCWVYRENVDILNTLQMLYGDFVNIAVVYTVEAHPTDTSPYFDGVVIGAPNFEDGILYPQADLYGQRKMTAMQMLMEMPLSVPLLIDAPCNEWWMNFGTNANCAFFIAPDGEILDRHKWFNRYPDDILETITNYFDLPYDPSDLPSGEFEVTGYEEDCVTDVPGATIITPVDVSNSDDEDSYFNIIRLTEDFPVGWQSSLCTDICFPPDVSETDMVLEAGTENYFSFYFYTNEIPGEGSADILIEHALLPDLSYLITLKACTEEDKGEVSTSLETVVSHQDFYIYPNPAASILNIALGTSINSDVFYNVYNTSGSLIHQGRMGATGDAIDINQWTPGIYTIQIQGPNGITIERFIKQ